MNADNRRLDWVLGGAIAAFLILPWYKIRGGFFSFDWIGDLFTESDLWPATVQVAIGRWQLWPVLAVILGALWLRHARPSGADRGRWLVRLVV